MALAGGSGTEYRLQTRESSAWYDEFRAQEAELKAARSAWSRSVPTCSRPALARC
jgi:hypothetical protein